MTFEDRNVQLSSDAPLEDKRHALFSADSREALCASWLAWLQELQPGICRSFVLLDNGAETLVVAAAWPENTSVEPSRPLVL